MRNSCGEVTERLKVLASKASVRETAKPAPLKNQGCGTRFGGFGDGKWGRRGRPLLHLVAHETKARDKGALPGKQTVCYDEK